MEEDELRQRVAELISAATGGELTPVELLGGGSLVALGVDSLGMVRLVDAIEAEYGVEVELNAPGPRLDSVDDVVAILTRARTS